MDSVNKPFRFSDPWQERIHRRLLLVGPGPASFYRDACRLIEQSDLQSTTHIVSHLLREIESPLRDVLQPIASPTKKKGKTSESLGDAHSDEIRTILDALEINENNPIGKAWLRLPGKNNQYGLHKRAHRRALGSPRELDDEFRDFWNEFNLVLDLVLDRFESRYLESHRILDGLLAKTIPTRTDVQLLVNSVPNNEVSFRYFFEKLDNSDWLPLFKEAGLFHHPPEPQRDAKAGTVAYPPWPQSRYLARIARVESTFVKEMVAEIALGLDEKGNVTIRQDLLDVALALPPETTKAFVPKAKLWVEPPHLLIADKLADVVVHLAEGGCVDAALDLATAILAMKVEEQSPIVLSEEESYQPAPTLVSRFDRWEYGELLRKVLHALVVASKEKSFHWICDMLDSAIRLSTKPRDEDKADDLSHAWRPAIENHEQNTELDEEVRWSRPCATQLIAWPSPHPTRFQI
jgi:hypothetical protein